MKNILITVFAVLMTAALLGQDTIKTLSGVQYVVLTKGNGASPVVGSQVKVMYLGKLRNGTIFDQSEVPFKYEIGDKGIIPGWNEGIQLMKEGEYGILFIPAKLGYAEKGAKNEEDPTKYDIPPNSDLIFEMQLLKVK